MGMSKEWQTGDERTLDCCSQERLVTFMTHEDDRISPIIPNWMAQFDRLRTLTRKRSIRCHTKKYSNQLQKTQVWSFQDFPTLFIHNHDQTTYSIYHVNPFESFLSIDKSREVALDKWKITSLLDASHITFVSKGNSRVLRQIQHYL